jgi:uncharacterized membrane-anchored protein YjiN (DUF445 family)
MKAARSKQEQLAAHKRLATGLFLLMLLVYVVMVWVETRHALSLQSLAQAIGYIKAFSEAAMVGALADWFAVTALFHHPLGLPIPHTNLIEKGKKAIGDNLGAFVVSNFLTPASIRPYIEKLHPSRYAASWLATERNQALLNETIRKLLRDIIMKLGDREVTTFIARRGGALLGELKLNELLSQGLKYLVDHSLHQDLMTALAARIGGYIEQHDTLIKEKVSQESYFFIPKFIDKKVADKITSGLAGFFREVSADREHPLRAEIGKWLVDFSTELKENPRWESELRKMSATMFSSGRLESYASTAWSSMKNKLLEDLSNKDSGLSRYLAKSISGIAQGLSDDAALQKKIDGWVRHTAYKNILRNVDQVGNLISSTIGNWEGAELSKKLELEVGKDLQFIRINGTIVGGLVGLIIYTITHFFIHS